MAHDMTVTPVEKDGKVIGWIRVNLGVDNEAYPLLALIGGDAIYWTSLNYWVECRSEEDAISFLTGNAKARGES